MMTDGRNESRDKVFFGYDNMPDCDNNIWPLHASRQLTVNANPTPMLHTYAICSEKKTIWPLRASRQLTVNANPTPMLLTYAICSEKSTVHGLDLPVLPTLSLFVCLFSVCDRLGVAPAPGSAEQGTVPRPRVECSISP